MAKDSTTTLLMLGAIGAAGYWAYSNGYFASFGLAPAGAAPTPAPTGGGTPAASAPPPVPPLGTTVTSAAQVLQQVAANDAFVIPDATTFGLFQGAVPGGYGPITTTDRGQILLRPDVLAAVNTAITNRIQKATSAGASAQSIQNAGLVSLADIQQMMTNAGLSGYQDIRRHMFTRTGVRF